MRSPEQFKEATLEACDFLAEKYSNPHNKVFFEIHECPLCSIYRERDGFEGCQGCFMNDVGIEKGCMRFQSFKDAMLIYSYIKAGSTQVHYYPTAEHTYSEFLVRSSFFTTCKNILKDLPANMFHPDSFFGFQMIPIHW